MTNVLRPLLTEILEITTDQEAWFVPLEEALKGLTSKQANQKRENTHSIAEICQHLLFWNERYLRRFKGETPQVEVKDNAATFDSPEKLDWEELKAKLLSVQKEWIELVKSCEEEQFSRFHPQLDSPWWSEIACLTNHTSYHIGQIVQIRIEAGNWHR
ncbi:DinB family protein [Risungbinella massiliensis]|uniref:DinB family protein n=1 Tax=Risungbinella massiliensis TaxID=1329796 RepID=UPI0005CC86E7|nr:DinB family protein [Risungbinella massiliensis]